jgi:GcrA cell cycle regulator
VSRDYVAIHGVIASPSGEQLMPRRTWTDEKLDRLECLWAAGKTATAIAASLGGVSRSAVLGKVFRQRLIAAKTELGTDTSENSLRLGHRRRGRLPGTAKQIISLSWQAGAASRQEPRQDVPATPKALGKSLFELKNESCRWPYGRPGTKQFYFCGVAGADLEGGRPYCEMHARRAYLPARKTRGKVDPAYAAKSAQPPRPSPTVQAVLQRAIRVANSRGMRF